MIETGRSPRAIDDYLREEIALGSFPSCSYAVGSSRGIEIENAFGQAVAVPLRLPAGLDTIYDCASITKPLVTTTLVLQAVAEEKLQLDGTILGLPYTVRQLLTHTSGLRAWLPLYATNDYLKAIVAEGKECEPGERVIYSDLNFVLLFYALREAFGDYVTAARQRIFEPLGLRDTMFNPPADLRPRIAATEWGQRFEGKLAKRYDIPGARQGLMWGECNDGNSFHAGGTAGNAGLFSTARDVFRIARAWARAELLPGELVDEAIRNQTEGLDDSRGLGWLIAEPGYGHGGFTGTSVYVDPRNDRIFVLLTNRIHPCAAPVGMTQIRARFHELAG
jgi:CubicO group peptidase (beta-lactamase class C family)